MTQDATPGEGGICDEVAKAIVDANMIIGVMVTRWKTATCKEHIDLLGGSKT
jgi:hypothetical protein